MKKKVSFFKLIIALLLFFLAFLIFAGANPSKEKSPDPFEERADLLTIDSLISFGSLERPGVEFLHDLHTDTMEKLNKDCEACHLRQKDDARYLSLKFLRFEDSEKQKVMEIYHTGCIGCHRDIKKEGEKSGPIEVCGQCHRQSSNKILTRQPAGYDKYIHSQHVTTLEKPGVDNQNCDLCHHEYNQAAKKLFYEKGKEGTCRYCHKAETEENKSSMRIVSHLDCIDCHLRKIDKKEKGGPYKCIGCHGEEIQTTEKPIKIQRIDRGQPDRTIISTNYAEIPDKLLSSRMNAVPFDHKSHEDNNESCRICHHASLESCSSKCHTVPGSVEGKFVNLERAMHQTEEGLSCIGCHETKASDPKCSSCHNLRSKNITRETSCLVCHALPLSGEMRSMSKSEEKMMVENFFESRKSIDRIPEIMDIKESILIKSIEEKYEPVQFPHRQIVSAIYDNIKENRLAEYFHNDKETICQGCHHNSPAAKTPPACSSCHGKPFDEINSNRPGLKGAYHQMCISCHTELNLEKPKSTDCNECHKPKG